MNREMNRFRVLTLLTALVVFMTAAGEGLLEPYVPTGHEDMPRERGNLILQLLEFLDELFGPDHLFAQLLVEMIHLVFCHLLHGLYLVFCSLVMSLSVSFNGRNPFFLLDAERHLYSCFAGNVYPVGRSGPELPLE